MKRNQVFKTSLFLRVFLLIALVTSQFGTTIHAFAAGATSESFTLPDEITIAPSDPVHIAYALWTSDNLGIDSRNGAEIAIDDSGGNILGHTIQFDGQDDQCSSAGGTAAGTALAADATVVAVLGTSCSGAAIAAMPLLAAAGMSMVSPSNTNPDLTDPTSPNHYTGYFRTVLKDYDSIHGTTAANFAYNFLGFHKAATIQDGSATSIALVQAFAADFVALGGTITLQTSISVGQTDMSAELGNIASGSPQMVYLPISLPEGGYVITQARSTLGLESVYLMGADALFTPDVVTAAGAAVQGFLVTGNDTYQYSPAYRSNFLPAYHAKFGYDPTFPYHAQAYDAFMLIRAAIEKVAVQDLDGTLHISRLALMNAMYATTDYPGLTGSLTCTPNGDCADPHMAVYRYDAGQDQPVKIWIGATVCPDPATCSITISPGDPVHIAYALYTSDGGSFGTDARNGAEIAIDDSGGKILGHTIQFDGQDDGCSPSGGETAGTSLSTDPTIVAVLGTSCSGAANTAMPLLFASGMSMVSPSNSGPDLTDPTSPNHYSGYFRTVPNDNVQGTTAADYAFYFLGVRKAATIQDGSSYSNSLVQLFAAAFEALGGTITLQTSISIGQTDMSSELGNIASGSPQLVYFPIQLPEGGYIITQARSTSGLESAYLMGADALYTPDVITAAGAAVEGFLVTGNDPTQYGPAYQSTFLPAYHAKFGYYPTGAYHAQAYDAFMLIRAAIEAVAVVNPDGGLHINRLALKNALYATKNFPGLTGSLTCSPYGDCADPHIAVFRYHAGQDQPVRVWTGVLYRVFLPLVRRK